MHILYVFVYRSVCIKLHLFQNIYQNTQILKKKKNVCNSIELIRRGRGGGGYFIGDELDAAYVLG